MSPTPSPTRRQTVIEKVIAFVDERVGLKRLVAKMLNEPVPGGSRWPNCFRVVLLFISSCRRSRACSDVLLRAHRRPMPTQYQYILMTLTKGWFC